jgi:26S proteasome regulatory subunit N1
MLTWLQFSLGIAYAGAARQEVLDLLLPLVSDTGLSMEIAALASLALGMTFVGTCHGDITSTILQTMMERDDLQLKETHSRFMALALALLYLGTGVVYELVKAQSKSF